MMQETMQTYQPDENMSDQEFYDLIAERRHDELRNSLSSLIAAVNEQNKNTAIIAAIEKNTEMIGRFVTALQNLKIDSPQVQIETNQDKVVSSLVQVASEINSNLIALKNALPVEKETREPPKKWRFGFQRNEAGYLQSPITAEAI